MSAPTANDRAFDAARQRTPPRLRRRDGVIGRVVDWNAPVLDGPPVHRREDGTYLAVIQLAVPDAEIVVAAATLGGGAPLVPGDLVAWVPLVDALAGPDPATGLDPRLLVKGYIVAKLTPDSEPARFRLVAVYGDT